MSDIGAKFGMHRLSLVRVLIGAGPTRAELHGIGHRLPSTMPIPLSTAAELAAAGVPVVVRDITASPLTETRA